VIGYSDDGLTMVMGDRGTDEGGRSRGHAHIYKYINKEWIQMGPNGRSAKVRRLFCCAFGLPLSQMTYFFTVEGAADGDNFGFAVAISGDGSRFAAGAPFSRAAFNDGGQVQSFDL